MTGNPILYAHQKIWDTLEAHPGFTALVSPPKRLKTVLFSLPQLATGIAEADTPQVLVHLTKWQPQLGASNTAFLTLEFSVSIRFAGMDIEPVAQLLWMITEALGRAIPTWRDDPMIHAIWIPALQAKPEEVSNNLWQIAGGAVVVEMHFPLTQLMES